MPQQHIIEALKQAVNTDATLNDGYVSHRQIIYTGLHDHAIERFCLNADNQTYIFKPLPAHAERFRELWTYQQIMPLLPDVYPQLLAYSPVDDFAAGISACASNNQAGWMILEDVGEIDHTQTESALLAIIDQMVDWHRAPTTSIQGLPTTGQKPSIYTLTEQLLSKWDQFSNVVHIHVEQADDRKWWINSMPELKQHIQLQQHQWTEQTVLCHGDLHAGNYGYNSEDRLIILDWEHCHLNTPLWDLYHLIDLSHPLFPRTMNSELRLRLLSRYWEKQQNPVGTKQQYMEQYMLFAIIFSSWMLLLIEQDLQMDKPIWSHEQLRLQQTEVWEHWEQCVQTWNTYRQNDEHIKK